MRIFSHVIRGKRYTVRHGVSNLPCGVDGEVDAPRLRRRYLRVKKGLRPQRDLEVLIHEALHAALWDLDEEAVDQTGKAVSTLLWKLGYRSTRLTRRNKRLTRRNKRARKTV